MKTGTFLKYDQKTKQRVIELCQSGKPTSEIVSLTGVNRTMVSKWTKGLRTTLSHPRYKTQSIRHDYFSCSNLTTHPERFVLVGFLAADGCVYANGAGQSRLCINLAKKDQCVLEFINHELSSGTRKIGENAKTKSCQFYIPSNQLCADLAQHGIVPRKTKHYALPALPEQEMRYFLRGYFYGDGCYHLPTRGRPIFHLIASDVFADGLKEHLALKNIHASVYRLKRSPGTSQVIIRGKNTQPFYQFIFHDDKMAFLPRKHVPFFNPRPIESLLTVEAEALRLPTIGAS